MTQPTNVPVGYQNTVLDYLHTKVERDGSERAAYGVISVPTGTTTTTSFGMVPFNKGARLSGLFTNVAALGTSVTADIGYVYSDNTNNTNKSNAFAAASTVAAAGGSIVVATPDVATWTATADGWILLTIGGATTGSTGNVSYRVGLCYDTGGLPT